MKCCLVFGRGICVRVCKAAVIILISLGLVACQGSPQRDSPVQGRDFSIDSLAKGDVDMVAEISVRQSLDQLRELTRKLYVRNPNQYRRGGYVSAEAALNRLFGPRRLDVIPILQGRRSTAAIQLALAPDYTGDRVQAFAFGMRTMLLDAYGGDEKFYLHDTLDPQKIYYLARNFEVAFWKLRHDRDPAGQPLLLSNELSGAGDLSFERLAGKLIALQDLMAQVIADSTNRQLKNVIQGVASVVFFPL